MPDEMNAMPVEGSEETAPVVPAVDEEEETATPAGGAEMPVDGAEDGEKPAEA